VCAVVNRCGFAHFLADARFAPLDAALFAYRRRVGAVALPLLAAASLLSKKLAAGIRTFGLDVRVGPHGNFGATRQTSRDNARVFCEAARILGMQAVAFLTPNAGPVQPFIGRGEALVALAAAVDIHPLAENAWLANHVRDCYEMARQVAMLDNAKSRGVPPVDMQAALVRSALEQHLSAQGSSIDALLGRVAAVVDAPRFRLRASLAGVLELNLDVVRAALVDIQGEATTGIFRDPAGLELLVRPGQQVREGDDLALLRCDIESARNSLTIEVARAFTMHASTPQTDSATEQMEVVHG
jgi:pyrimidine-nucleoside phosphorylase